MNQEYDLKSSKYETTMIQANHGVQYLKAVITFKCP